MTKIELQDMILKNIQDHLSADTTTLNERIDKSFTDWFQALIEKPEAPSLGKEDDKQGGDGGAGGGAGEQPPAPEGGGA